MLNSNNERAFSRSSTLTFVVLLSVAALGPPAAQAQSPWSGSFDERFTNQGRVAPTFTRPEAISGLPSLPLTSPDESALEPGTVTPVFTRPDVISGLSQHPGQSAPEPATTASTNPPR